MSNIAAALSSLRPGAEWQIQGDLSYENIVWLDDRQLQPTAGEVSSEIVRLSGLKAWAAHQAQAQAALDASDITMIRCVEHGVAIPAAWVTYRAALRSIISTGTGAMPPKPAYPAGT